MIARCPGTPGSRIPLAVLPHCITVSQRFAPSALSTALPGRSSLRRTSAPTGCRTNDHQLSAELIRPNARSISKDHLSPPQAGSVRPGNSGTRLAQLISARSSPARSDAVQQGLWCREPVMAFDLQRPLDGTAPPRSISKAHHRTALGSAASQPETSGHQGDPHVIQTLQVRAHDIVLAPHRRSTCGLRRRRSSAAARGEVRPPHQTRRRSHHPGPGSCAPAAVASTPSSGGAAVMSRPFRDRARVRSPATAMQARSHRTSPRR